MKGQLTRGKEKGRKDDGRKDIAVGGQEEEEMVMKWEGRSYDEEERYRKRKKNKIEEDKRH